MHTYIHVYIYIYICIKRCKEGADRAARRRLATRVNEAPGRALRWAVPFGRSPELGGYNT